jgi:hypothetical protein
MLFDLRGRGRRRTVQIIYLGLALIFLVGFIGFGVGVGGGGGGLYNAIFENNNGSGSASFAAKVEAARKRTQREPQNAKAWAALTEAQLHQAGEEAYSNPATGQFTSKGKQYLNQISQSWNTYLKLQPHNPSPTLAQRMLTVYSEEGLNQASEEVAALQIVIPTKPPSAALYASLAQYSYRANNRSQGDLAAKKAVSLAPASERARIKSYLEGIKKNPTGGAASSAATGSSVPSGTYTTTINGKKTVLKASGSTPAGTSSTPASSTTK